MEWATRISEVLARQAGNAPATNDGASELLKLLQNPFGSQLQVGSLWASIGTSFGVTGGIALLFSLVRPYHTVVYAPKLKHADELHAPPPLGKGIFAWVGPLWKTTEKDLVRLVGMDATLFMRFTVMCRNIFVVLSLIGCAVLIPVNMQKSTQFADEIWITRLGPANVFGDAQWALVVVAWLFNITVCGFLWWNYRKVMQLRRTFFESQEYQMSLHSRTLMLYDIPKKLSSDEGIARIVDEVAPSSSFSRTAIARNVRVLPELISEHEKTVRKLEKVLAKYLKDPHKLPAARPVCPPSKKDRSYETYPKGQKVDAIEYLTQRIKTLEMEIKEVRQSVDKRTTMTYGFASYSEISEAHSIAFASKKKRPQGATINLAPRPNDIIWDNMPLSKVTRARRRFINNVWVTLLTLVWIVPNAMMAVFLVNLGNLGLVWPAFQVSLEGNSGWWKFVQGVAAPALTSGIYLLLPIIFRRLAIQAGDQTKSGRERHVTAKLYAFFIFNNLVVFSIFGSMWQFVAAVIDQVNKQKDGWQAFHDAKFGDSMLAGLCNISPFWITWLLQRQLGVAIDLAQLWPLFWGFIMRKFSSPTPRELIELTAPPPFDYASYYNYFLFYSTVALCFAGIQPLVLPAAAIYFIIDVVLRKYLILYIFVTKTESGGMFWRVLFNRFLFGTILANLVTFLIVFVRGNADYFQSYAVAPLPFLLIGFKIYCAKVFDDKIHFYTTRNVQPAHPEAGMSIAHKENLRSDRLASRFGHPALYKPLMTPMVHAKAQNILASVYSGRLTAGREAGSGDATSVSGYSDTYAMDPMHPGYPGKVKGSGVSMPGFEVVPESKLDFEFYKNRDEFAQDHGGGDIFGSPSDLVRPGTPGSSYGFDSRPGTPLGGLTGRRVFSPQDAAPPGSGGGGGGTAYLPGYHRPASPSPPTSAAYPGHAGPYRAASPGAHTHLMTSPVASPGLSEGGAPPPRSRSPYAMGNDSATHLVGHAQGTPTGTPGPHVRTPGSGGASSRDQSPHAQGRYGGGPQGYGNVPQEEAGEADPMAYDYFRGSRRNTRGWGEPGAGSGSPGGGFGGHGGS